MARLKDLIVSGPAKILGRLYASGGIIGDIEGNASTATKLQNTRNVTLTGSVTGTATFDGSGDLSITTKSNHGHAASVITESETKRFVSDAEKSAWNAKPTKAEMDAAIAALAGAAPELLNTLDELAAALGDDPNFATTITSQLAGKLSLSGGTLTGQLTSQNIIPAADNAYSLGSSDTSFIGIYGKQHVVRFKGIQYGALYTRVEGTASANGECRLSLGNSTASGTAGNASAMMLMYGTNTGYTALLPANNTTSNYTIYLPEKSGTLALLSDLPDIVASAGNYLPLSGGTLSGNLIIPDPYQIRQTLGTGDSANHFFYNKDDTRFGGIGVAATATGSGVAERLYMAVGAYPYTKGLGLDITADSIKWKNKDVLHGGNYSSYALPLSGGTMTGDLKFGSNGTITYLDSAYGGLTTYVSVADSGWERGWGFVDTNNNAVIGKFGIYGYGGTAHYLYMGSDYVNPWFKVEPNNGGTFTGTDERMLKLETTSSHNYIHYSCNGVNKAATGYYNGLAYLANAVSLGRIGVDDSGEAQYWTHWNGNEKYRLLHTKNYHELVPTLVGDNFADSTGTVRYLKICTIKIPNTYSDIYVEFKISGRTLSSFQTVKCVMYKANTTELYGPVLYVSGQNGNCYSVHAYKYVDSTNGDYVEIWGSWAAWDHIRINKVAITGNGDYRSYVTWNYTAATALPTTSSTIVKVNANLETWTGNAASASKLTNTTAIGSSAVPVYFNASGVPVACNYGVNASIEAFAGSFASGGWKALGGRTSGNRIAVGYNSTQAAWNSQQFSSSILFGSQDTKGLLDCGYSSPTVTFGGGSIGGSTDDAPNWYFKLKGTSGVTYTLPSKSGTLALTSDLPASASVGGDGYVPFPDGGVFTCSTQKYTGLLKIQLPVSWTNTMMKFKVSIYNYANDTVAEYIISGYNYAPTPSWNSTSAYCVTQSGNTIANLPVSFGHDGTYCAITIGTTSTVWDYPQVVVSDVIVGYSSKSFDTWKSGWVISFVTSVLPTINRTISNTGAVKVPYGAAANLGTAQARNISGGTAALTTGTSTLNAGDIYVQYSTS